MNIYIYGIWRGGGGGLIYFIPAVSRCARLSQDVQFLFSIWPWLILDPLAAWTSLLPPFYTLHQALQSLVLLKYYDRGASGFSSGGQILSQFVDGEITKNITLIYSLRCFVHFLNDVNTVTTRVIHIYFAFWHKNLKNIFIWAEEGGGGVLTLLFKYFSGFGRSTSFSSVFLSCSLLSGEQEGHSFLCHAVLNGLEKLITSVRKILTVLHQRLKECSSVRIKCCNI